ncbi:helix-turn-helix domain-containing protein [Pararhizobium sp.]|uniref:helix-turn-helix domain-containing protein n=1 Tax=Pararhizobium sp. TaxID=1977563 RepID=UPI003D10F35A
MGRQTHLEIAHAPHTWRRWLYRTHLPASGMRVGLALIDKYLNRRTGRCDPSYAKIAEECDLSPRTVRDGVASLVAAGLLSKKKKGLRDTLSFEFQYPNVTDFRHSVQPCNVTDLRRAM